MDGPPISSPYPATCAHSAFQRVNRNLSWIITVHPEPAVVSSRVALLAEAFEGADVAGAITGTSGLKLATGRTGHGLLLVHLVGADRYATHGWSGHRILGRSKVRTNHLKIVCHFYFLYYHTIYNIFLI